MSEWESFAELCAAHCDGRLTEDQRGLLEQRLKSDEAARAFFIRYMNLESALDGCGSPTGQEWAQVPQPAVLPALRWLPWALAASRAALLAFVFLSGPARDPLRAAPRPDSAGVALLASAVGAVWETAELGAGASLPPGRIKLRAGLVRLEFYSGATVLLEGPADFELRSIDLAVCHSGKLRAIVPAPAAGFTILTAQARLVDLGTEFGIEVAENGPAEVHVFDGRVEVHPPTGPVTPAKADLTAGRAARIDQAGQILDIPADPTRFISAPEAAAQAEADATLQFARWREARELWKDDPRLLAYFDFERNGKARRLNSLLRDKPEMSGTIIGCRWVEGRWQGKDALEFKHPGDRIRLTLRQPVAGGAGTPAAVPRPDSKAEKAERAEQQHLPALTFAAWVRVDSIDQPILSLLSADGERRGSPTWQITGEGKLQCVLHRLDRKYPAPWVSTTPPVIDSMQIGRWLHVALSLDTRSGRVCHYFNGRLVEMATLPDRRPLRGGAVELGNWGRPAAKDAHLIRRFNGRMDEVMIFGAALDEPSIQQLYHVGRPAS